MEKEKSVMVPIDVATVKKWAKQLQLEADPDRIFEDATQKLSEAPDKTKVLEQMGQKLAMASGVGSQYALAETVQERYRSLFISFSRQLIEEYHCTTASEIAVAEMTAKAFVDYTDYSKLMTTFRRDSIVMKQVERSSRQFFSALGMLRHMKSPPVSVNITAKTAFVGQNQVNAINPSKDQNHEPI